MKKLLFILPLVLLLLATTACDSEITNTEQENKELVVTGDATSLYVTGVEIKNFLDMDGAAFYGVVYSTTSGVSMDNKEEGVGGIGLKGGVFKVTISGLEANTKYYYRAYVRKDNKFVYGEEKSFTTKEVEATASVVRQKDNTATIKCTTSLEYFDLQTSRNKCGLILGETPEIDEHSHLKRLLCKELIDGTYVINIEDLEYYTKYYYRAYTCIGEKYTFSEVGTFTTDREHVGHAVDLGLSVKWADWNVGAASAKDYGYYYAWGDTKPQGTYCWSFYKFGGDTLGEATTYIKIYPSAYNNEDNKVVLLPEDDAAAANWGTDWRMPTREEMEELRTKCTWSWSSSPCGFLVTGINGNSIFLPAAGCANGDNKINVGSIGYYWTSTRRTDEKGCIYAHSLTFSYNPNWTDNYMRDMRHTGLSVRPVCE